MTACRRILHIGDCLGQAAWLAKHQTEQGFHVVCSPNGSREVLHAIGVDFDIIHIHHYQPSSQSKGSRDKKGSKDKGSELDTFSLRKKSPAIIHQIYDRSFVDLERCYLPGVVESNDLLLLSRGDCEFELSQHRQWFAPCAVVTELENFGSYSSRILETTEIPPQQVRVLAFGEHSDDPHVVRVLEAVAAAQNARFKFHFTLCDPTSIKYQDQLVQTILDHHLVIEHSDGTPFGALAIESLALGRCVMSGARAPSASESTANKTSPIIDIQSENLGKKLQNFIKEPRALRDLSKRSRDYVNRYHNPIEQARKLNQIYEALLNGKVTIERSSSQTHS